MAWTLLHVSVHERFQGLRRRVSLGFVLSILRAKERLLGLYKTLTFYFGREQPASSEFGLGLEPK